MKVVNKPLSAVRPYEGNPRKIGKQAVAKVAASIAEFGWRQPIVVDEDGIVLVGHTRYLAAQKLGHKRVPVHVAEGLTEAQKAAYRIADNRVGEESAWDVDLLAVEIGNLDGLGFDLALTGLDPKELRLPGDSESQGAEDDEPEAPKRAMTRRGDVWALGEHRLVCGDSFEVWRDAVGERQVALIATDPPYAIYGSSTGVSSDAADDKMVVPFFKDVLNIAMLALPWFGHAYLCCDWRSWSAVTQGARQSGMAVKNMLVWDKGGSGMGNNYANAYELIGFFAKLPAQKAMGNRKAGQRAVLRPNLMRFAKVNPKDKEHNAAKPVALMEELITNSSEEGDVVLEPFAGSGTTLIACERLGRVCYGLELTPRYVDVIVRRWQKFADAEAYREGDGATMPAAV